MSKWTPFQHRPTVLLAEPIISKRCPKCGAEFQTQSRRKKRCGACQQAREAVLREREAARQRKARAGQ